MGTETASELLAPDMQQAVEVTTRPGDHNNAQDSGRNRWVAIAVVIEIELPRRAERVACAASVAVCLDST